MAAIAAGQGGRGRFGTPAMSGVAFRFRAAFTLPGAERSIQLICRARAPRTPRRATRQGIVRGLRLGPQVRKGDRQPTAHGPWTMAHSSPQPTHVASAGGRGVPGGTLDDPRGSFIPPIACLPPSLSCRRRRPDGVDRIIAERRGPSAIRSMGDVGPSRGPGCVAAWYDQVASLSPPANHSPPKQSMNHYHSTTSFASRIPRQWASQWASQQHGDERRASRVTTYSTVVSTRAAEFAAGLHALAGRRRGLPYLVSSPIPDSGFSNRLAHDQL
jgi:hypothetical protein